MRRLLFGLIVSACIVAIGFAEPALGHPREIESLITLDAVVDGNVSDGLNGPYDGIPDRVSCPSVVQVLNTNRSYMPFEDRGIIEFDISELTPALPNMFLYLEVHGSHGPYPFQLDLYTFDGDGVLTLDDFILGDFFSSYQYVGRNLFVVDVTAPLVALVSAGADFAGFNIRFAIPSPIASNGPYVAFLSMEVPPAGKLISEQVLGWIFGDGLESGETTSWDQVCPPNCSDPGDF